MATDSIRSLIRDYRLAREKGAPKVPDYPRPKTYGDCLRLPRPCPFVGCRHHLMLDVKENGSLKYYADDVTTMRETCAIDIANDGPLTLRKVGKVLGDMTNERIRQVEEIAMAKYKAACIAMGIEPRSIPKADYAMSPGTEVRQLSTPCNHSDET